MTQDIDALRALRDAVKAGTLPEELVCPTYFVTDFNNGYRCMEAYHGSINAAHALQEAVLPEWRVLELYQFEAGHWLAQIYHPQDDDWPKWTPYPKAVATDADLARAWLLAILEALIAHQGAGKGE